MPKVKKILYLLAVLSALCLAASYHPLDLGFLAWFALTPFLYALRQCSLRQAAGISFVFGYTYGAAIFHWLPTVDGIGLPVFLLLLSPIFSLYYVFFGLFYRWSVGRTGALTPFLAAAFWVVAEYTRGNMFFLSLPWNLLGHTQHAYIPVIQITDITGVYGVSFLLVLVNDILSRWLEHAMSERKKDIRIDQISTGKLRIHTFFILIIIGSVLCYGFFRMEDTGDDKKLRVAIVQPGTVLSDGMNFDERYRLLETNSNLTLEAEKRQPDLIVWPASSLPGPLFSRPVKAPMRALIKKIDSHLLVGGSGAAKMSINRGKGRNYANTEFLLSPEGIIKSRYYKIKLVPFNEYLPLGGKVKWPRWITTLEGNFTPGPAFTLFKVNDAVFGAPICWENLFPDFFRRFVRNGANFMVNPNNEAYMGKTAGPHQTMAMTVFRAVENRVTIARASSTGISAFIEPSGRVDGRIQDTDGEVLFVSGILVRDVPLSTGMTLYTRCGDVFALVMIGLSVVFALVILAAEIWGRSRPEF